MEVAYRDPIRTQPQRATRTTNAKNKTRPTKPPIAFGWKTISQNSHTLDWTVAVTVVAAVTVEGGTEEKMVIVMGSAAVWVTICDIVVFVFREEFKKEVACLEMVIYKILRTRDIHNLDIASRKA